MSRGFLVTSLLIFLTGACSLFLGAAEGAGITYGKKRALVIGIDTYAHMPLEAAAAKKTITKILKKL